MKALFKLALVLLLANALFRFVPPYWRHHQFDSALEEAAQSWLALTDQAVTEKTLAIGAAHGVPIGAEHITIRRSREHLYIDVSYVLPIEFVPTMKRPWRFESQIDSWTVGGVRTPMRR